MNRNKERKVVGDYAAEWMLCALQFSVNLVYIVRYDNAAVY